MATVDELTRIVQALQAQQQEIGTQLTFLSQENETLRQERTASWGQLPELVAAMRLQAEASQAQAQRVQRVQLVDTRGIGRPSTFSGKEEDFRAWAAKTESFVISVFGESFRQVFEWAAERSEPIEQDDWMTAFGTTNGHDEENGIQGITDLVQQLHAALSQLTDGESFDITQNSGAGNGLEAWRRLHRRYDPATGGRKRVLLRSIIDPGRCRIDDLGSALERWEELVVRYERRRDDSGRRSQVPEDIKMAALESLVPEDLEKHLFLNQSRLGTYELLRREITSYLEARTGVKMKGINVRDKSREHDPNAMDVDSMVRDLKGRGKPKGGRGKGGKGKDGKGDRGGKGGQSDKNNACFVCGKFGHRAAECWSRHGSAQKGDKGGGSGGKGDKGKGGKGKPKGRKDVGQLGGGEPESETNEQGSLDLDADIDLNAFETNTDMKWQKFNLDTGAAATVLPTAWALKASGPASSATYRTASGQTLKDRGAGEVAGEAEGGAALRVAGRIVDVHKPLVSAAQALKGRVAFLTATGGAIFKTDAVPGKRLKRIAEELAHEHYEESIPLYQERGVYNFYAKTPDVGDQSEDKVLAPVTYGGSTSSSSGGRGQGQPGL